MLHTCVCFTLKRKRGGRCENALIFFTFFFFFCYSQEVDEDLCKAIITSSRTYHSSGQAENLLDQNENRLAADHRPPATGCEARWRQTVSVLRESFRRGDGSDFFPLVLGHRDVLDMPIGMTVEDLESRTG